MICNMKTSTIALLTMSKKKKRQEDTVQSATGTQEKVLEKKGVRAATLSLLTQTFILDWSGTKTWNVSCEVSKELTD